MDLGRRTVHALSHLPRLFKRKRGIPLMSLVLGMALALTTLLGMGSQAQSRLVDVKLQLRPVQEGIPAGSLLL
ncbi:hypothetical protein [Thermostichus sp. MS-CIW-37]